MQYRTNIIKVNEVGEDLLEYTMKSNSCGYFADPKILVGAETGGHGCLFTIKLPVMSIDGQCWAGDEQNPELKEILHVLNRVFKDYNIPYQIIKQTEIEEV